MNPRSDRRLCGLAACVVLAGLVAGCQGPFPQSTFDPATSFARDLDNLFKLIFGLAVIVFVVVEGVLIYAVIRFRARPGQPPPKPVHGHTTLEIAWTLAPAFIIALIAIPTVSTIWKDVLSNPVDPLEVQVVGRQWWWEFRYPQSGVVTANELHLPQGRPVVLTMTSADVVHSFWAPRLGGKRDVILGRTNRLTFAPDSVGVFFGQCAEFCGTSHANMRFRVIVQPETGFDDWVQAQLAPPVPAESLSVEAQRGLDVYRAIRAPANHSCLACHAIQGVSAGVLGPNLTHLASRSTIAGGVLSNDASNLARWLRDPGQVKPGAGSQQDNGTLIGMPNVGLTEAEIAALVAYLQTLR